MELKVISDNIDRLLRLKRISADKASREAGHPDAIRNIRRKLSGDIKGQGVSVQVLHNLARALGVLPNELTEPAIKVAIPPVPGLRGQLLSQLSYLDRERERVIEQLDALGQAEITAQKRQKRKVR